MSDERRRDDDPAEEHPPHRPGPVEAEMDSFDPDEFGGPLFAETSEQPVTSFEDDVSEEKISFGSDDSGSLPHWTDPPTGEVPRIGGNEPQESPTDDLDVWSSFASEPVVAADPAPVEPPKDPTGELVWHDDERAAEPEPDRPSGRTAAIGAEPPPPRREPARIMIGTDPSGMPRRPESKRRAAPQRPAKPTTPGPAPDHRNLPVAVASGLVLAAVFLAASMWRPAAAVAFVTVALGLAGLEYFTSVTEKGYRPVLTAGVAACVAAPLAAYWVGESALPLVIALAFLAGIVGFIAADSIEAGPMPNMAITMLGIVWIGLLGAYAALILRWSTFGEGTTWGTDTMVLIAVGVVANDVGAYFTGSAIGKTPLRQWISPNKSLEGLLGGTILTLLVFFIVGLQDLSDTWSSTSHLLWLGIVISIFAPLGDLTESMFKRNLDIKDFGTIVRGHGGVLDRFDGFLFALPAVYYLFRVLEPWTAL